MSRMNNVYTTLDSYQAGFLVIKGFRPSLRKSGASQKIVYEFQASEDLYDTLAEYHNGAIVEALQFALSVKTLKSQIFSMRRSEDEIHDNRPFSRS